MVKHYERRLPHWQAVGQPLFITFRLHGSLPAQRVFPPARMTAGEAFVAMDRILDEARSGPMFLRQAHIAQMVIQALEHGETQQRYKLHSFVVMANHVHLLVTAMIATPRWLGPLKGFTAHEANRMLERSGPFWQDESYDHVVRDDAEFRRIQRYIEWNPVKAGLVVSPESFPWSSASRAEARLQAESLTPR
jgi:REP element-mobilizing transposase RayT